ncbi:hypothetical protein ABT301_37150 [Streptomyces sp. NPDC000987]|uniref:hypothetical protein n=1 Tax=Streptomyces sp. NPDC000987 TaxID=3154374 RepID=UPI00332DE38D
MTVVERAGEGGLGVGVDKDQGDGVGVRLLLGERPSAFQAALADPYGDVAAAGPGGRPLPGGEHGGELRDGLARTTRGYSCSARACSS